MPAPETPLPAGSQHPCLFTRPSKARRKAQWAGLGLVVCLLSNYGEEPAAGRAVSPPGTTVSMLSKVRAGFPVSSVWAAPLAVNAATGLKSDNNVYPEPPLPALPAAGGKIIDPTFGTTIMRITDPADGNTGCQVQYSYWPTFNKNSTRMMAICHYGSDQKTVFWQFNPSSFTFSGKQALDLSVNGEALEQSDLIWSGVNADVVLGHQNARQRLWAYNVATGQASLIKDFSGILPSGSSLSQMSRSIDDNVFAASIDGGNGVIGYIVWRRSDNKVLLKVMDVNIDEVQIDKSGRYLTTIPANSAPSPMYVQIWDLAKNSVTKLVHDTHDSAFGHYDSGHGILFTDSTQDASGDDKYYGFRSMATPKTVNPSLHFNAWGHDEHFSMLADNEQWGLVSTYMEDNSSASMPFMNEILQVGQNHQVRRIAHHRSLCGDDYYAQPHANISRDGRFVAFTSNWGQHGGRHDVFVVHVPPAPGSASSSPSPAPGAVAPGPAQPLAVSIPRHLTVKAGAVVRVTARTNARVTKYHWTQMYGQRVTVANAFSSTLAFRAPQKAGFLLFRVAVIDGNKRTAAAFVTIQVVAAQ